MNAVNSPHPAPAGERRPANPDVPAAASDDRLALAAVTDGVLALAVGLALSQRVFPGTDGAIAFLGALFLAALAVSFVNHVLGTLLFRGSAAKLVFGLRVLRWKDGRRPRLLQTLARWLFGFIVLALQFVLEGASVGQACGLRTVRRGEWVAAQTR